MHRILMIDDDKELCAIVKQSVLQEKIETDYCHSGISGLEAVKKREYQLVILDVMMSGLDGFGTLEQIRQLSSLPVLMLTAKNDNVSKVRGLRAGADDYLTKPFNMDELVARVISLIRRYTRFNQPAEAQQLHFDGLTIDLDTRSITSANGTFGLHPKEFDLLLFCARHQGKILTKQQIYEEVWGGEYVYWQSSAGCGKSWRKIPEPPGIFKRSRESATVSIKRCDLGYEFNRRSLYRCCCNSNFHFLLCHLENPKTDRLDF